MRKYLLAILVTGSLLTARTASAQVGIGIGVGPRMGFGGYGGYYGRPNAPRARRFQQPPFKPVLHFSVGYGYPNLDKNQFLSFYNYYRGTVKDIGTVTGALDLQYSRNSSIGVIVSHGFLTAPYYDYNASAGSAPAFNGSLENWTAMLNLMQYMPVSPHFVPYIRTAIGLNFWDERYKDGSGNKIPVDGEPTQLAYQVGLGAKVYVSHNTGFFLEAGYGKYIVHGGLTFKL